MSWANVMLWRVRNLFRRRRLVAGLDEEIRFHLDMQIAENRRAGMSSDDARYAALRQFGAVQAIREQYREGGTFARLEECAADIRYAIRTLRHNVTFTLASVTTLALGFGVTTAFFAVVDAVLLEPLPYRAPHELAMIWTDSPGEKIRQGRSGYWNFQAWRKSTSFSDMAVFDAVSATLATADTAERVTVVRISPNFFSLLGIRTLKGRYFTENEAEDRSRVALISYAFWQSHFAGSSSVIGASFNLNGVPSQVIGVLPQAFRFPGLDAQIWEPHTLFPDWESRRTVRGIDTWSVVARLRSGVPMKQAQAEMSAIAHRLEAHMPPGERNRTAVVMPFTDYVVGPRSRRAIWLLAASAFCVLLVAGLNTVSLSLARAVRRTRELAVRLALGATAARIARQLITEGLIVASLAASAGCLVAVVLIRQIRSMDTTYLGLPLRLNEVALTTPVLGIAGLLVVIVGVLVGLAPVGAVTRTSFRLGGESARTTSEGRSARSIRRALVVGEVAVAIVLVFSAALLVRSWQKLEDVETGFLPEKVLTIQVRTPVGMAAPQRANFYRHVLDEVESLPGVDVAGFASDLVISSTREQGVATDSGGRSAPARLELRMDEVSAGFFRATGTRLLAGRFFTHSDVSGTPRVVIINDALARRLWPGQEPLGRKLKLGTYEGPGDWLTVVGVVANMRRQGAEREPVPQLFESVLQNPSGSGALVIRTTYADPMRLAPSVQQAIRRVDKHAPVHDAMTLDATLAAFLRPRRLQTALVIALSLIAVLLASVGVYGLIHYSVAARTKEIGIRMALGARRGSIFRMVLHEGLRLGALGIVCGGVGAALVSQFLSTLLFGISPADPLTILAVPLLLIGVSAAACYAPARRAMNIEPVIALRDQ